MNSRFCLLIEFFNGEYNVRLRGNIEMPLESAEF
jgi:hypothetical protein